MSDSKKEKDEGSEFGKGLIVCLVKFAEHWEGWLRWKRDYEQMRRVRHEDTFEKALTGGYTPFSEATAVELFFSGASDHMYEIEVPKAWKGTEIDKKVKELQEFALDIGHGHTGKRYEEADVKKAYDLCKEIALLIDKKLGLKPELGQW